MAGQPIQQAFLGTCTNARLEDLQAAAEILRGQKVRCRLVVIPASSEVYMEALRAGVIETLLEAGAAIGTPGCGPCMGNHMGIPAPDEITISTANRNFKGRMGTKEAPVYLASPVCRGGKRRARADHRSEGVSGMMTTHRCWVYGDNVNTDVIFPGRYTYTLTAPQDLAAHALEDLDTAFAGRVQPGDVIVAGRNWGCGSSREQAVSALKFAGVTAIVAASFSRIYFRNCINQGVLPIVCAELNDLVQTGDTIQLDRETGLIIAKEQTFVIPRCRRRCRQFWKPGDWYLCFRSALKERRPHDTTHYAHSR